MIRNIKNNFAEVLLQAKYVIVRSFHISPLYIVLKVISSVLRSVMPVLIAYFSATLLDSLSTGGELAFSKSITNAAIIVAIGLFSVVINSCINKKVALLESKINYDFSSQLREKMATMDFSYTEDKAVSEKRELASGALSRMGGATAYVNNISAILSSFITIIGISAAFFNINIIVPILIIILQFFTIRLKKAQKQKAFEFSTSNDKMNLIYSYTYFMTHDPDAAKDARIFGLIPLYRKKMGDFQEASYKLNKKTALTDWLYTAVLTICNHIYLFVSYGLFVFQAVSNTTGFTLGSFSLAVAYSSQFNGAIQAIIDGYYGLLYNSKYVAQYRSFLDIPNEMYRSGGEKLPLSGEKCIFRFENVCFKYPKTDTWVLDNVNCTITSGNKTALVGENGSGKSTFIKLLLRLYDVTSGTIYLNNKDIRLYSYEEYHKFFSVVFQDFDIVPFSVRENINISVDVQEADERIWSVLEKVGLMDYIKELEEQDLTYVQPIFKENGINFSGGEKQKLAIARALYKDASMMVLDEPTAALDPRSEYEIFQMYQKNLSDKTAILVSHRLSSCRMCDNILVFKNGTIVQQGDHNTLVDCDGLYKEMWNAQAKYYV